jgi:hypothetical protein
MLFSDYKVLSWGKQRYCKHSPHVFTLQFTLYFSLHASTCIIIMHHHASWSSSSSTSSSSFSINIHSFNHSCIQSIIHSFIHSFNHSLIHLFIHVFIYIHIIYWPTPLITDLSLWPWASSKVLSSGAASHAKYAAQCLAKAELFRWKRWRKWGKWWSLNSSCRDEPLESLQAGFWLGLVINVMDMVFYNVL